MHLATMDRTLAQLLAELKVTSAVDVTVQRVAGPRSASEVVLRAQANQADERRAWMATSGTVDIAINPNEMAVLLKSGAKEA